MATKSLVKMEYRKEQGGGTVEVEQWPEASGQSFKAGQLVYQVSGLMTACADDAVLIWGISTEDASGTANTMLGIIPLTVNSILSGCAYHATAASAITAWSSCGLLRPLVVANNKCYVDVTDQTTPCFVIYKPDPLDEVGDIYGRFYVKIVQSVLQTTVGA